MRPESIYYRHVGFHHLGPHLPATLHITYDEILDIHSTMYRTAQRTYSGEIINPEQYKFPLILVPRIDSSTVHELRFNEENTKGDRGINEIMRIEVEYAVREGWIELMPSPVSASIPEVTSPTTVRETSPKKRTRRGAKARKTAK